MKIASFLIFPGIVTHYLLLYLSMNCFRAVSASTIGSEHSFTAHPARKGDISYCIPENLVIPINGTESRKLCSELGGSDLNNSTAQTSKFADDAVKKNSGLKFYSFFHKAAEKGEKVKQKVKQMMSGQPSFSNITLDLAEMEERKIYPILVFVNKKSGGKMGHQLLHNLNAILHEIQICDLTMHLPSEYLSFYQKCKSKLRIICCGGDGTVSWIMQQLRAYNMSEVPIAVVPLGTGNDLYRVLSELGGYPSVTHTLSHSEPDIFFSQFSQPRETWLDLWRLSRLPISSSASVPSVPTASTATGTGRPPNSKKVNKHIHPKEKAGGPNILVDYSPVDHFDRGVPIPFTPKLEQAGRDKVSIDVNDSNTFSKMKAARRRFLALGINSFRRARLFGRKKYVDKTLSNYFGIGVDGHVSLLFDGMRKLYPLLFFSQIINKLWYMLVGLFALLFGKQTDLSKVVQMTCDGVPVAIPSGTRGIIVSNIASYAGGTKLWTFAKSLKPAKGNAGSAMWKPSLMNDKILEVVAVMGIAHLGQIKAGLASAIPIAQGTVLEFVCNKTLPMQVDGEPWRQRPCKIRIEWSNCAKFMIPKSPPAKTIASSTINFEDSFS